MGIFETFTKRLKRRQQAGKTDVYTYDTLPETFRVQVIHIWVSALGRYVDFDQDFESAPASNQMWSTIQEKLSRELGVFSLGGQHDDPLRQCEHYVQTADTNAALDLIELTFRAIDVHVRGMNDYARQQTNIRQSPDSAIQELNHRFREHSLGYQFSGGEIIRVDSQFLHAEVVQPAITLLRELKFAGAADEFLRAHEHYRKGRHKEAMNEALKAFESTMKTICDERRWKYPARATSKPLLDVLFSNGLIPADLATHFAGFRAALEAGLPTLRNRNSGHGQGADPKDVPPHLVSHALHLAASNIVLLVEAHKAL